MELGFGGILVASPRPSWNCTGHIEIAVAPCIAPYFFSSCGRAAAHTLLLVALDGDLGGLLWGRACHATGGFAVVEPVQDQIENHS